MQVASCFFLDLSFKFSLWVALIVQINYSPMARGLGCPSIDRKVKMSLIVSTQFNLENGIIDPQLVETGLSGMDWPSSCRGLVFTRAL